MTTTNGEKFRPAIVGLLSLPSATFNLHIMHKTFTVIRNQ